ncbi:MAG: NADH-quinone oxidoreductase subunit NuoB [Dermatophilaceae bacterium]
MPVHVPNPGLRLPTRLAEPVGRLTEPVRALVEHLGQRHTLHVLDLPLACCAVEYVAAGVQTEAMAKLEAEPFTTDLGAANVLVVSGTLTDAMAPTVRAAYEAMSQPRYVISFGSCASSGGPYWDSYSVTKGVDQIVPVDVFVPGCPPRPEALLQGIARLRARIAEQGRA